MQKASIRHWRDRLRHTLLFELFGIALASPLAAWILGQALLQTGWLVLWMSLLAMSWNLLFNWGFDLLERNAGGHVSRRNWGIRWLHAGLFELSLAALSVPLLMFWLGLSVWPALWLDLGFTVFYTVYTLLFNRAYDQFFPLADPTSSLPQANHTE